MITRVEIKNYKCLADVSVDLTPVHAVIGPNDSGKTSFLEAVTALLNMRQMDNKALPPAWDGHDLVWHGATEPVVILKAEFIGLPELPSPSKVVFTQQITFEKRGKEISTDEEYDPEHLGEQSLTIRSSSALRFCFNAAELARPAALNVYRPFEFDEAGHGLATLLSAIQGHDHARFDAIEDEFCKVIPGYSRLQILPANATFKTRQPDGLPSWKAGPGMELWFVEKKRSRSVRATQASDGALIFLAMLALKHVPKPPSVILLEEPENSIHPQRLQDVVRIMREIAADGPQVIMASHSPYLLDYLEPEEVTVFTRDDTGAAHCLRMSDSEKVKREIKHFNLGEIWTADWEEKLLAKAEEGADA